MSKKSPDWARLFADSMMLGLNANLVIGLRLAKLARGGSAAGEESRLMVEEKLKRRRTRMSPRRRPYSRARRISRPSAP